MLLDKATGANSIVQDKYVTVSVCKKNIEEARSYFSRVVADLIGHFPRLWSKCVELDATERLRMIHDFFRSGEETAFQFDMVHSMRKGHDFKDFICPDTFEFEKDWALHKKGFKRVSDDQPVDITQIPEDDQGLYYKDEPYTTKKLHQRLIITYSPKYALYQKTIRDKQVERAQKMMDSGKVRKERRNPNDPARFIAAIAATKEGEVASIHRYLDEENIESKHTFLFAFLHYFLIVYWRRSLTANIPAKQC